MPPLPNPASLNVSSLGAPRFRNLLLVIKQTAFEDYSQLKLRGLAPKALRWSRLESRHNAHKSCVEGIMGHLRDVNSSGGVRFNVVSRGDLDRQHLHGIDLVVAVGGDGTVLSSAHYLDNGSIPIVGINSDPSMDDEKIVNKQTDERRSHGALCMFTSKELERGVRQLLYGTTPPSFRTRIQCTIKSSFSETRLVPGLNDMMIAHPIPASVSRFRMGWLGPPMAAAKGPLGCGAGGGGGVGGVPFGGPPAIVTSTRFGSSVYDVSNSFNVWSSGMWVCTPTGASAAMAAAGGRPMDPVTDRGLLQYKVREHLVEQKKQAHPDEASGKSTMTSADAEMERIRNLGQGILAKGGQMHLRWNSAKGGVYIDGSHLCHNLELGDELLINSRAPELMLFDRQPDGKLGDTDCKDE